MNIEKKYALISVFDKTNLSYICQTLAKFNIGLISTGSTAEVIKKAGFKCKLVSDLTKFNEILDGRVKTLHPKIHASILHDRKNKHHINSFKKLNFPIIDFVIVNLYPFVETVQGGNDFAACIENIDIGGPAMIRAAAKNHDFVTIITDPQDYAKVIESMQNNDGAVTRRIRRQLAATAFSLTATYDSNISSWLIEQMEDDFGAPRRYSLSGNLKQTLRYGENPHQKAALYVCDDSLRPGAARAKQLQGKELSYNNINDTDAAFELVAEFDEPTVAIIKHANPCGVASASDIVKAYDQALACDPVSAFGGIIAVNRPLSAELSAEITKRFVEVIIAPSVDEDALPVLQKKSKIRVLQTGAMPKKGDAGKIISRVAGGFLLQDADIGDVAQLDLKVVSDREPTEQEMTDMLFAFRVAKHVKSNAIVYAKNGATVGVGAGQMSRIDSARIAAWKAQEAAKELGLPEPLTKGSVVASDAFFPFADGLISAAEAGVSAVIQPGGSIRDQEVIDAANERGLAMVFTGMRHFRH